MNIRPVILSVAIAAPFVAVAPFAAVSAFAAPVTVDRIAVDRSPVVTKQSGSAYSLCQAELRRRMGGTQSSVSISSITDSTPTATTIRLTGEGTYRRDASSRSQPFNFACVVNLEQARVTSLSYTFAQQ